MTTGEILKYHSKKEQIWLSIVEMGGAIFEILVYGKIYDRKGEEVDRRKYWGLIRIA